MVFFLLNSFPLIYIPTDDPLSAVDAHVGKKIFDECIKMLLKSKTVLLVTHQLQVFRFFFFFPFLTKKKTAFFIFLKCLFPISKQFVPQCDHVVFMDNGRITEQGTYDELMAMKGGFYSLVMARATAQIAEQEEDQLEEALEENSGKGPNSQSTASNGLRQRPATSTAAATTTKKTATTTAATTTAVAKIADTNKEGKSEKAVEAGKKLMTEENREQGSVSWSTYIQYSRGGGSIMLALFVFGMFVFVTLIKTFSDYFLSFWIGKGDGNGGNDITKNPNLTAYIVIYSMSAVALVLFQCVRGYIFNYCTLRSSSYMHHTLFDRVISAPMSFFDSTPVGRILNRFAKDLDSEFWVCFCYWCLVWFCLF